MLEALYHVDGGREGSDVFEPQCIIHHTRKSLPIYRDFVRVRGDSISNHRQQHRSIIADHLLPHTVIGIVLNGTPVYTNKVTNAPQYNSTTFVL